MFSLVDFLDFFYLHLLKQADGMIISITGATGFIGKRLVQRLLAGMYIETIVNPYS